MDDHFHRYNVTRAVGWILFCLLLIVACFALAAAVGNLSGHTVFPQFAFVLWRHYPADCHCNIAVPTLYTRINNAETI